MRISTRPFPQIRIARVGQFFPSCGATAGCQSPKCAARPSNLPPNGGKPGFNDGLKIVICVSNLHNHIDMKKQAKPAEPQKGFLALAGEALHVLGEEIVEGKDKVVETASEKFTQLKKAVGNITHKKKAVKRSASAKASAGKSAAKAKKAVKKAVKKVASKAAASAKASAARPTKTAAKKTAKKAVKTTRKVGRKAVRKVSKAKTR